jgi:hypothetical protein
MVLKLSYSSSILTPFTKYFSLHQVFLPSYFFYRQGFRFDIGFIDHLNTRLISTSNYCATTNLHNLQITTAPAKPFPACSFFTSRFLATALTVEILQLHTLKSCLHKLLYRSDWVASMVFLITSPHEQRRKPSFQQYLYCCMSIRAVGTCLPSLFLNWVWYICLPRSHRLIMALHATISYSCQIPNLCQLPHSKD